MKLPTNKLPLLMAALSCLLLAGCTQQARIARHQAKADKYFEAGDYTQAEIEYLNVAKLDPEVPHAFSRLGLIYFENGRMSRAYPFLKRAEEMEPANLQTRLKLGLLNLATGNTKAAREEALFILDHDPKFPEATILLAQTGRTPAEAEAIRQRLDKLVTQTGVSIWTELGFGMLALQTGKLDEARTRFTNAQTLDPKSPNAQLAAGSLSWAMNDLVSAEHLLKLAAELSPARSSQKLAYANFKLQTGAIEEGKQWLTEITKRTPDYLPAWNTLAEIALSQKQWDECSRFLQQIQTRDPENYQAEILSARLQLAQGRVDAAVAQYERIAQRYNRTAQSFFQLGLAYHVAGDNAKALKNFNQAVALEPNFDEAILWQAQMNTRRDDPDSAIKSLTQLLQRRPQLESAHFQLANAYAIKGDFANALATCRRLEKLRPNNPQIPFAIGGLLMQQDKVTEARQAFAHARELSPDFQPAFQQLVALDIYDQNFASAMRSVQIEIDKHPDQPELLALRAQVLMVQTNLDQAEADLKKAIELDANYRPAYMMLADLYVNSKKNEQALAELNQYLTKKTNDVPALLLIGMIQKERGNFTEARAAYEHLLTINPNSSIALNNLACLYSEQFDLLDKAYDAARKARDLSPNDPAAADTLGWILFKRGEYTWAVSLLQASAEKLSGEPEVLGHLGMTYYMMNDEVRASNTLHRAVAFTRDFPGKDEARKRLALLALDFSPTGNTVTTLLEKRLAEQPDDPVALTHLAAIYQKQGAQEKAAQLYEQVIKQNSGNPRSLINLASLYADHLNNPQKALDLAKAAYKLAPNDVEVAHVLGRLVFGTGQYKWALTLLQQGDARKSADAGLLYDLALALYSMGQTTEAEATLRDALLSNPNFAHAKEANQFLNLFAWASDPAKAAEASPQIQQILKADPDHVPALMAAAAAAEQRGDLNAASGFLEQALQHYPDFTPAAKKLASNYSETPGKEQRAYELAVKARAALPTDEAVARTLGIIYYQRGDFAGAVRYLNQGIQNPAVADGKSFYYMGMAQFKLKRLKESKATLQQALTKNLPAPLADDAKRTLAQIK